MSLAPRQRRRPARRADTRECHPRPPALSRIAPEEEERIFAWADEINAHIAKLLQELE
ncbi:hypothetical protein OIU91_03820 [Streptomyces sp. NBC_01456]|uniref:hypothetical protein n=1 Tax=unclassified Streptomyces TaxID=2593676 RepID=UPI002E37C130|nr:MULTISPECIES: hypothetical protein [unclassified Streptomyces]